MTTQTTSTFNEAIADNIFGFVENFQEGLLLFDEKQLIYMNAAARQMLQTDMADIQSSLSDILGEDEAEELTAKGYINKYIKGQATRISIESKSEGGIWLRLTGQKELSRFEEGLGKEHELNKSMRKILMKYDQNSLVIADGNGTIIFAGQETVENCGYEKDWYLGKSVYDLEKKKVFYPSVIRKVLETGREQVVLQKTQLTDKLLVAIGIPFFEKDGVIAHVISITKDYTEQINLSNLIADMEFGMDITNNDSGEGDELENIITCDDNMFEIKNLVRLIAPTKSTVLILGETGTGKEVLAHAIHSLSNRKNGPFVVVSCGSLSPNIVESELFGYEAGSFTGATKEGKMGLLETANGGTVFLDEIGELPLDQQVKLLHVLQEKSIIRVGGTKQIPLDIRVIAATNRDLQKQIELGQFREDLYYRLNVVSIEIPPLIERRGDISLLTKYFTKKFNSLHNKNKVISKNVMKLFSSYDWPGNIRELENSIENLIITSPSNYIDVDCLPKNILKREKGTNRKVHVTEIASMADIIEEAERQLLTMAKEKYKTTSAIAKALSVNQSTISRKLNSYGIK